MSRKRKFTGKDDGLKENVQKLDLSKELEIAVYSVGWGNNNNIFIKCVECKTGIEFFFSAWWTDDYKSKSGDFDFREWMENLEEELEQDYDDHLTLIATFSLSKGGFLNCISARFVED